MAENEMSLVMRIRSLFDGSGAKAASDAQTELAARSKTAGDATAAGSKNLQQAGQVAGRAAEQIGTVAGAMGATGGAAGQAAAGVRLLSGAIQTMTTAGGGLAGLVAAIGLLATSALVNWLVKVSAETKKLNEEAGKTNDALTAMSKITLDAINAQQEKMRKTASDTADQYERILQAKNRMLSSQEQADLAQNDYEKAVELSRAPKDDQFAARRIEAEYTAKAAAVSQAAERARRDNEVAIAESKVRDLRSQAANADTEAGRIGGLKSREQQRLDDMQRQSAAPSMKEEDRARLTEEIGKLQLSIAELTKAFEAAQAKGAAARSQLPVAEMDALTSRTVRAANDIRTSAQGVESRNAFSGLDYEQQKASEAALSNAADKQAAAAEAGLSRAQANRNILSSERDLRTARNSGDSSAVAAALDKAAAAQAERDRIIIADAQRRAEQANRTAEAVKNLPNN